MQRPGIATLALICATFFALPAVQAQMKTGENMRDWYRTFDLDEKARSFDLAVTLYQTNQPGNIYYPGEQPQLTIQFRNNGKSPIKADVKFSLVKWHTQNIYGDIWRPLTVGDDVIAGPAVAIDLAPGATADAKLMLPLPEIFGGYALIADAGPGGRQFVSSLTRVLKNESKPEQYPKQSGESFPAPVLSRVGLQAIRYGIPFEVDPQKRARVLEQVRKDLTELKQNNIAVTVEIGAGSPDGGQPLGMPRPHLSSENIMLDTKSDWVWLPQYDAEFRQFCHDIFAEYGWPKGPVNGTMLWNEPWEGISISGWGADMIRYRDLYKIMAEAAHAAQKDAKVEVLVGGCDSSSNTFDKLFPNESDEFLPDLDFCSIHYQGMSAPSLYRKFLERQPKRVLIWDTESWVANSEDLLFGVIAANRAAGYDRSMGFFGGNVFGNREHNSHANRTVKINGPGGDVNTELPLYTYPMAAAVAALQKFIGNREFKEILFQDGLPWIFVFDGLNGDPEDGTVIVLGDLNGLFGDTAMHSKVRSLDEKANKEIIRKLLPNLKPGTPEWAQAKSVIAERFPDAVLVADADFPAKVAELLDKPWPFRQVYLKLDAAPGKFALFDTYGNIVPPAEKQYQIELNTQGRCFRSTAPGGFAELIKALKNSRMTGLEAVKITVCDFTAPVAPGAQMKVMLQNLTNQPVSGNLTGTISGLTVNLPQAVSLPPFAKQQIMLAVKDAQAAPDNRYLLQLRLESNGKTLAAVTDYVRSNVIARRTVTVDGKLDDWAGALPQVVSSDPFGGGTVMEKAWLPFEKFDSAKPGSSAAVYLAGDDQNFYLAAKIPTGSAIKGAPRYAQIDEDQFFYPATVYRYNPEKSFSYLIEEETPESTRYCGVESPTEPGVRLAQCIRPKVDRLNLEVTAPLDRPIKVTFYLPWENFRSRRVVYIHAFDQNNRLIAPRKELINIVDGVFATYEVAGKVNFVIQNPRTWHKQSGRVAGIFFDPAPVDNANIAKKPYAKLVNVDESNPGLWQKRFGQIGVMLPGINYEQKADFFDAKLRTDEVKTELNWPEGVRRYSYRMRPVLPDGAASMFDNIQLAFNTIDRDNDPVTVSHLPGRVPGFVNSRSSDYEFALNPVAPQYGGDTEIWRLEHPGTLRKHFFPRQPKSQWEGAVTGGKLEIRQDGNTRIFEAAIPWSEIPRVKAQIDRGEPVKLSFRINQSDGSQMELGRGRSVTTQGGSTFHPDWKTSFTNEIEFMIAPQVK